MSFNPCNLITYSIVHFLATEFLTVPRRPSNGCEGYALIGDCDAIANLHVLIVHTLFDPFSTKDCLALPSPATPGPASPCRATPG
jgi:hypothetical protein